MTRGRILQGFWKSDMSRSSCGENTFIKLKDSGFRLCFFRWLYIPSDRIHCAFVWCILKNGHRRDHKLLKFILNLWCIINHPRIYWYFGFSPSNYIRIIYIIAKLNATNSGDKSPNPSALPVHPVYTNSLLFILRCEHNLDRRQCANINSRFQIQTIIAMNTTGFSLAVVFNGLMTNQ